jgi:hypothetical protein
MTYRLKLTHKDGTPNRAMGRLRYGSTPRIGERIKVRHAGRFIEALVTEVADGEPNGSDYVSNKVHVVSAREIDESEQ